MYLGQLTQALKLATHDFENKESEEIASKNSTNQQEEQRQRSLQQHDQSENPFDFGDTSFDFGNEEIKKDKALNESFKVPLPNFQNSKS